MIEKIQTSLSIISSDQKFLEDMVTTEADLRTLESIRYRNYVEFWRLYRGFHWAPTELDSDKPTPWMNKTFVVVNKGIAFLQGKTPTINYPSEKVEPLLAPIINLLLENSGGMDALTFEMAQMGGVTGDCFLKILWVDDIGVCIQVLDSEDVSVRYSFNNYNNAVPEKVEISWKFLEGEGDNRKLRTYKEVWTRFQKVVYIDNNLQESESGVNILQEIPIVHIRNFKIGKDVYGMSDIKMIESLNKLLNHQIRRFSDDVDYHGDPITLLYGAKITTLERGEGKLWGNLPIKSKVENLTLETDFPAQQKFMEYMENAIHEVASIPKSALGGKRPVSNLSGVAMHMENLPIIELTDRKRMVYGPGLERAIGLGLKLMAIVEKRDDAFRKMKPQQFKESRERILQEERLGIVDVIPKIEKIYKSNKDIMVRTKQWNKVIVQFQDYLPKDKLLEMQLIAEEMKLKLLDRKRALQRLGKDNIEEILKDVDEEDRKQREAQREFIQTAVAGAEGQPVGEGEGKDVPNITQGMRHKSETPEGAAKGEMKKP